MTQWLKDNVKWLVPVLSLALGAVGAWAGVKFTIKTDPNATQPEIIIVVPDGSDGPPVAQAGPVVARGGLHPVLLARARVAAARMIVKQKGVTFSAAWAATAKVPAAEIAAFVVESDPEAFGALGDGSRLKAIIDWLSDPANQEKLLKIAEFIFRMAMKFFAVGDVQGFNDAMGVLHQLGTLIG